MKHHKFRANDSAFTLACETKMGGVLFHLAELDGKPFKRLFDADRMGELISEINTRGCMTIDLKLYVIEQEDAGPLALFLEKFK